MPGRDRRGVAAADIPEVAPLDAFHVRLGDAVIKRERIVVAGEVEVRGVRNHDFGADAGRPVVDELEAEAKGLRVLHVHVEQAFAGRAAGT